METVKNAQYFHDIKYDVVVKKRGNKFILFICELGIFEEDENLDKAYQKVLAEKDKYIQKMVEFGLEEEIIEPRKQKIQKPLGKNTFVADISLFLVKLVIVLAVAAVGFGLAAERLNSFVASRIEAVKNFSFSDFARDKANSIYNNIIDMPDEKVERGRMKAQKAVKKFKPIVDEFKVLFKDTGEPGSINDR